MSVRTHHEFGTTELDPDLLSTPFRIQTKWHVISGARCSGKTTLIHLDYEPDMALPRKRVSPIRVNSTLEAVEHCGKTGVTGKFICGCKDD